MKFFYKWIPRILMISSYFLVIGYLINKYAKTTVVEETTTTLPIPILILIIILSLIVFVGGFVIMLLSWWEQIKADKFSFYTFAPFSLLFIGVIILSKLLIHKGMVLIEINTQQFLLDLQGYNSDMTTLLIIIGLGTLIGGIGKVFENQA